MRNRGLLHCLLSYKFQWWITTLLIELQVPFTTPTLFCDNQGVVSIAHNPDFHNQTKHMEIEVFFVREVMAKQLCIYHIPALDQ